MTKYLNRSLARAFGASMMVALLLAGSQALQAEDAAKQKPLMKDFVGINADSHFKPDLMKPVCNFARNYHPISWDNNGDSSAKAKYPMTMNGINLGELFGASKKEGIAVSDCIQIERIPAEKWKKMDEDAYNYAETFAKYFGSSGENLVTSVEIGNEPAKWSNENYKKLFEPMAKGFRAGDPKLKIVTAAAAASNPDRYSKPVSCLEGLTDLYDVLNVHTYSMVEGFPTWRRVYPEHADIAYLKVVDEMVEWRNGHAPGKEIWVTEFGYDANSGKKGSGDFSQWVYSTETEQAQWLVRSLLAFAARDVDRAYIYDYSDEDDASFHGSSGITRSLKPKPAYHALAHFQKTLGDYRFSKVISKKDTTIPDGFKLSKGGKEPPSEDSLKEQVAKDEGLYVYEFVNPDKPTEPVWVVWAPSGAQREATVKIPVTGQVVKAERMPLKEGGAETVDVKSDAGTMELSISESPTYIWLKQ